VVVVDCVLVDILHKHSGIAVPADALHSPHLAAPLPVAPLDGPERLACLRLIRSENVGPVTFRQLINHFGGAARALDALPDLARRGGRRKIRICSQDAAEAELEAAHRIHAEPLFTIEPGYPAPLAAIDHPPPLIYARGRIELLNQPGIGIVGSRNCSTAGHAFARQLAGALGEARLVVISGLARGIDGAAHEAAIETGTIAVVAGGLDVHYPPEHTALQQRIGEIGCLVSEMPPGFKPRAKDFPRRNRIISGISYGVVIVEAARRSGTLITARLANEQGREVFAVPGHPLDPRAEGTNRLIKSGATMITEASDILEVIKPMLPTSGPALAFRDIRRPPPKPPVAPASPSNSTDSERRIIEQALGPTPIHTDDLLRSTKLSAQSVQIALLELSLAGRLEHHGAHLVSLQTPTR
jgi:DNA processing protein